MKQTQTKTKMGSFHLLQSKNKKDNQPLQTHGRRHYIQKHKHNTATHKTKTTHKNTIKVEFTHSPATYVNWRASDKPVDI